MSQVLFLSNDNVLKEKNLEILQQSGLEASGALGCLDGLVMMDKNNFDVVVIDDELSDISGFEACLKVRQQQGALIVLLGTIPDSDAWARVEELGFDLYLRKPISPRELLARIKALLRRPGAEKEVAEAAPVKQVAETSPKDAGVPAKSEAISAGPKSEKKDANTLAADQQPVSTPESEVRGPVYSQRPPGPVEPKIDIQKKAVPAQEQITVKPRFEPSKSESPVQSPVTPPQQDYVPPSAPAPPQAPPSITVNTVQNVPENPVVAVPKPVTLEGQKQAPVVVPPLGSDVKRQPPAPFVINPAAQQPSSMARVAAQITPEEAGAAVLEDPRVIKLLDALVSGKLPDINPVVDFNYKKGFAYPSVNSLLDTSEVDTINILDALANSGILIKQSYEKFYIDPDGLFQLVPIERCPRCDSSNIVKGQLVEHFSCGYVGLDRDFKQESRYVCPKCRKDLRLIGTDYRNVGIHYRCQDCSEVSTVPVVKWRNMKTRKIWTAEELREVGYIHTSSAPIKKVGWNSSLNRKLSLWISSNTRATRFTSWHS